MRRDQRHFQYNVQPPPGSTPVLVSVPQEPYTALSGRNAELLLRDTPWVFHVPGQPGISVAQLLNHDWTGLYRADVPIDLPPVDNVGSKVTIRILVRRWLRLPRRTL